MIEWTPENAMLLSTAIELKARTAWFPDHGVPSDCRIDLYVRVEHSAVATLSAAGARSWELDLDGFRELVALGEQAVEAAKTGQLGFDTAVGRWMTSIDLMRSRYDRKPELVTYGFNHYLDAGEGTAEVGAFLDGIAGACAELAEPVAALRRWFG